MKINFGFTKDFEINVNLPKDDIQGAVNTLQKVDLSKQIISALAVAKKRMK